MKTYKERSPVLQAVGSVTLVAGVGMIAAAAARLWDGGSIPGGISLVIIGVFVFCVYGEVAIDSERITVRLAPLPRRIIERSQIRSVEAIEKISPMRFGGWGWRKMGVHDDALILGSGPGVRISLKDGSSVVVSGRAAEGILAALRS